MRTQEEIVAKIKADDDILGFRMQAWACFLDKNHIQPFLKEKADPEKWQATPNTRDAILADMKDYMEFAWGKVKDHRGISAGRSVNKMEAWLWLLGDEGLIEGIDYAQYGAPILKKICDKYGFPAPDSDEIKNMIDGEPCEPECEMGSGSVWICEPRGGVQC